MSAPPPFDVAAAHKHFSVHCFNAAWDLIDKPDRTADEDRRMVETALASLFHWRQRPDCTEKSLSVGCWQASRVYALVGQAAAARDYAEASLAHAATCAPFYLGYAYEALARAAALAGDPAQAAEHLVAARALAAQVEAAEEREMLQNDLDAVAGLLQPKPPFFESAIPANSVEYWAGLGNVVQIRQAIANGGDVNAKAERGYTALHAAAENGRVDAIRLLLELGADVHVRLDTGETPFDMAAAAGRREAAILLKSAADRPRS